MAGRNTDSWRRYRKAALAVMLVLGLAAGETLAGLLWSAPAFAVGGGNGGGGNGGGGNGGGGGGDDDVDDDDGDDDDDEDDEDDDGGD